VNISMLIASIREHEGLSLVPYKDTEGHLTIGYGHNLDAGISLRQAYLLLDSDIEVCMLELDKGFPGWREHPDHVQNVLLEMQFNLGRPRLAKFTKMWAALANDEYETAAKEMLNSKWAKQVGQRAVTLSKQMAEGFQT
jgi:lysozyme